MEEKVRFIFLQDDDSHWYMVPRKLRDEFFEWVKSTNGYYSTTTCLSIDFSIYRLEGGIGYISFIEPQDE